MLGVGSPEIRLGCVIYGRVSGYPWWPAVVTNCPNTNQWTKGGKFWVTFLNDTTGAWLKPSQIRLFDRYNGDLCQEHNSSVAKFRRYQERLKKAESIAERHLGRSSKPLRVKVLPPTRSKPYAEAQQSGPDSQTDNEYAGRDNIATLKRVGNLEARRLKETKTESGQNGTSLTHRQHEAIENQSDVENAGVSEVRPKRKRMRSTRYLDNNSMVASNSRGKPLTQPSTSKPTYSAQQSTHNGIMIEHDERREDHKEDPEETRVQIQRRSLRLRTSTVELESGVYSGKRSRRKRGRSRPYDLRREQEEVIDKSSNLDSVISLDTIPPEQSFQTDRGPPFPNGLGTDRLGRDTAKIRTVEPAVSLTKQTFVTELKDAVTKSSEEERFKVNGTTRLGRVRSLVGVGSRPEGDSKELDGWTDTEERPERERKVNLGSLEAAAEDLVECAITGCRSDSSDLNGNAPRGCHIALSNRDLVPSILNRLSNVERDVKLLKKRAVCEDQATLGEDATAAGVKSAVEALAAASLAFAKARDYNVTAIRRSIEMLWPDQEFPLTGADGDLLRTVAQSLILASCKRRHADIAITGKEKKGSQNAGHGIAESSRGGPPAGTAIAEVESSGGHQEAASL